MSARQTKNVTPPCDGGGVRRTRVRSWYSGEGSNPNARASTRIRTERLSHFGCKRETQAELVLHDCSFHTGRDARAPTLRPRRAHLTSAQSRRGRTRVALSGPADRARIGRKSPIGLADLESVIDFAPVARDGQAGRVWPDRPDGCPASAAVERTGTFYRFTSATDPRDWHLPCERYPEVYKSKTGDDACRCHAFSVYSDPADIPDARDRYPKFKSYKVLRFEMTEQMGVSARGGGLPSHHSWWPSVGFVPPPDGEEVDL